MGVIIWGQMGQVGMGMIKWAQVRSGGIRWGLVGPSRVSFSPFLLVRMGTGLQQWAVSKRRANRCYIGKNITSKSARDGNIRLRPLRRAAGSQCRVPCNCRGARPAC